jgi:hypothetical protein
LADSTFHLTARADPLTLASLSLGKFSCNPPLSGVQWSSHERRCLSSGPRRGHHRWHYRHRPRYGAAFCGRWCAGGRDRPGSRSDCGPLNRSCRRRRSFVRMPGTSTTCARLPRRSVSASAAWMPCS